MNELNLPQQPPDDKPDSLVGDVVVFIDDSMHDELMTVSFVEPHSVFMDERGYSLVRILPNSPLDIAK